MVRPRSCCAPLPSLTCAASAVVSQSETDRRSPRADSVSANRFRRCRLSGTPPGVVELVVPVGVLVEEASDVLGPPAHPRDLLGQQARAPVPNVHFAVPLEVVGYFRGRLIRVVLGGVG